MSSVNKQGRSSEIENKRGRSSEQARKNKRGRRPDGAQAAGARLLRRQQAQRGAMCVPLSLPSDTAHGRAETRAGTRSWQTSGLPPPWLLSQPHYPPCPPCKLCVLCPPCPPCPPHLPVLRQAVPRLHNLAGHPPLVAVGQDVKDDLFWGEKKVGPGIGHHQLGHQICERKNRQVCEGWRRHHGGTRSTQRSAQRA